MKNAKARKNNKLHANATIITIKAKLKHNRDKINIVVNNVTNNEI